MHSKTLKTRLSLLIICLDLVKTLQDLIETFRGPPEAFHNLCKTNETGSRLYDFPVFFFKACSKMFEI